MPGVDWMPGVSQLKSTVQLLAGDKEGAKKTQENFLKECPVVSQVTSVVQLARGDLYGAIETQERCVGTINNVANGIPVVGHVKGAVHHIVGDHEGGNQALNAATRTTVVVASGAAAGLTTGGLAAIPAGIAAGAVYDTTATVITDKPQGSIAAIENAIKNPSAGAIFDAAVIPVGDGLAGYSGGQLANKISTQIKINRLEAVRAAKTEQINSALFEDLGSKGATGGSDLTTGQLHALGKEINALTSEISALKHGTPQYWFDAKSGKIVVETTSNNVSVPVIGYFDDENNTSSDIRRILAHLSAKQENAIYYDSYIEVQNSNQNRQARIKKLENFDDENTGNDSLKDTYPRVPTSTKEKIKEAKQKFQRNNPNKKLEKRILSAYTWLHVQMPSEFNYTGAIMLNSLFQGLLHSFVRHGHEWEEFVTISNDDLNDISTFDNYHQRARRSDLLPGYATEVLKDLLLARNNILNDDTYIDVQSAYVNIQFTLYDFIQRNLTYDNYLGRTLNIEDHQQLYFKVKDKKGNVHVMVICVSDNLFPPATDLFPDSRPIRTITTVFFTSWNKYLRTVLKKKEDEKK